MLSKMVLDALEVTERDTVPMLKLISWNVHRGFKKLSKQVEALSGQAPHIVALQEVTARSALLFENEFARIGLPYIAHTFQDDPENKPSGVLIASRFKISRLAGLPHSELWSGGVHSPDSDRDTLVKHWTKRTLFITVKSTWGDIDLYNVHITPYYGGERLPDGRPYHQIKLELLAGVYRTLSCYTNRLRILCGDFNTPQEEMPDGEIITWGYDKRMGNYTLARPYQHEVEFKVLRGLASFDLPDAYRSMHGYENGSTEEAWSWQVRGYKRRYDHIFASKALRPLSAQYLQNIRTLQLSDHTPIEVVFEM